MCGRYTFTQDLAELEKLDKFIGKIVGFKPSRVQALVRVLASLAMVNPFRHAIELEIPEVACAELMQ